MKLHSKELHDFTFRFTL